MAWLAMSEEDGRAQHPLKGAILCTTSLTQDVKAKVGSIGAEMGATHKLDLTSDVTHLLVGNVDSEKYRHVAKRRPDILVLQPEWLFAVRDAWVQGDEFDLDQLNMRYQLPTFHSLNICVTGFNDARQRQWLEETTTEHGAQYHGDLTRAVTHLVAAKPTGAKYDRAKQWNIKVVSLRWFERSLERHMILDESAFDPLIEEDKQGEGAYDPQIKKSTGKRTRSEATEALTSNVRRKMRRTASARLSSQSQNMWQDITTTEGEASLLEDSWSQSAGVGNLPGPTVETQPVPEDQKRSLSSLTSHAKHAQSPKPLFSGWACFMHGHSKRVAEKLRQLLEENGATIVENETDLQDPMLSWTAMILPAAWIAKADSSVPSVPAETKLVTEWWVERCIVHKRIMDPDKDMLSQSMHTLPKDCFHGRVVSTSGFGQDVRYVAKIVEAAGGTYEEGVSRKVNLLLFNNSNDLEKPAYCAERSIDVVTPEWFYTSLKERTPQAVYPFMLAKHLCDAIQRIISAKRKSESQAVERKEETQKTDSTKQTAQRLSGIRRKAPTPALALAKSFPAIVDKEPRMKKSQQPFETVDSNSQERSRSQTTPPIETVHEENGSDQRDKENDEPVEHQVSNPLVVRKAVPCNVSEQTSELLSGIIARQQNSGSVPPTAEARKKRTLGRAPSGNTMTSFARQSCSPFIEEDAMDLPEAPVHSQQVTYEAPGAEAHRRLMGKKIGPKETIGHKVEILGTVKDIALATTKSGVGARVRGRHREVNYR